MKIKIFEDSNISNLTDRVNSFIAGVDVVDVTPVQYTSGDACSTRSTTRIVVLYRG